MSIEVTVESVPITVTVQDQAPITVQIAGVQINPIPYGTPASATDTGTTGTVLWDSDYLYVCVDTDTWKRVAISTWP